MNNPLSRRPLDYFLLWAVALASLAINLILVTALLLARGQVAQAAGSAAVAVRQLRSSAIDYTAPISQSMPVSFTVDYQQELTVPISVTLPIDTVVTVPLNTPLGNFPITVPVKTTVPIRLSQQVPLSFSVPVSLTLPVSLTVPVHIAVGDTPLGASLNGAADYLDGVAASLGGPGPAPTATP